MIRAVVFDIGGVLEVVTDTGIASRWERRLGLAAGGFQARFDRHSEASKIGAITEVEWRDRIGAEFGLDESTVDELVAEFWAEYLGVANDELIAYVGGLRPRYRTGILSNSWAGARERETAAYGFPDLVDDIVYSDEVGLRKPDPRVYALACSRLGVRPEETVFVDNVAENVTAAERLGMHGVLHVDNTRTITTINGI